MVRVLQVIQVVKVAEIIRQKNKYSLLRGEINLRKEYHFEDCDFTPLVAKFENLDKITLGFGAKRPNDRQKTHI